MIEHQYKVAGDPVLIRVVEHEEDLDEFRQFVQRNTRALGVDSETTGLDTYSDSFRCRLAQFGTATESYVVPVEKGHPFTHAVIQALYQVDRLVLQNASYDLQVFDRCLGVPMEELWPKVLDTRILAHLVNPRGVKDGGWGHSLEELTMHYIDPDAGLGVKNTMKDLAAETKGATTATIWKKVDLDNPRYQLYAGMDPILAARLASKLAPLVPGVSEGLIAYEHRVAEVCAIMERTGFLLDVEYAKELSATLRYDESRYNELALSYGCEMVNSTEQVADTLEGLGVKILGRTPSGKRKVDDDLLARLVNEGDWVTPAALFAHAVIEAKKAGKWRKTWVDKFLSQRDANDRCHASINPLQARTGRMSITGIPAQTLPAGDWMIRRCFLADEGQFIASVDYQAQELRVLAALSGDPTMKRAFESGDDLHQITADASGVDRKIGKMVNFAYVYGSGPKNIAEQAGISIPLAQKVIKGFESAYPQVRELSLRLQKEASAEGFVTTPFGRRLPVDPTRAYSALNYVIQSSSRDITAGGIVRLHDSGYTPYLRLPIHDEILASLPEAHARWGAEKIGKVMATEFEGVWIGTDAEVGGRSWGSLYGADY